MAGTTVESASRAMARMKKAGVIDSGREWVSVLDRAALERLIAGD
jgi:CRP/FNR family transcriptional regulator